MFMHSASWIPSTPGYHASFSCFHDFLSTFSRVLFHHNLSSSQPSLSAPWPSITHANSSHQFSLRHSSNMDIPPQLSPSPPPPLTALILYSIVSHTISFLAVCPACLVNVPGYVSFHRSRLWHFLFLSHACLACMYINGGVSPQLSSMLYKATMHRLHWIKSLLI